MSDGSIAIVRGGDYHVDFIKPDGSTFAGPKLAYDWRRISESERQTLIDSARASKNRATSAPLPDPSRPAITLGAPTSGTRSQRPPPIIYAWVSTSEILDYWPAIRPGAVTADQDKNLWVLPTTTTLATQNTLTYDVIDVSGKLSFRVRLPEGRSIAGFGTNQTLYLMFRNAAGIWQIERRKLDMKNEL